MGLVHWYMIEFLGTLKQLVAFYTIWVLSAVLYEWGRTADTPTLFKVRPCDSQAACLHGTVDKG